MTTTETLPKGFVRLDEPCWHLVNQFDQPEDTGDGYPHYETQAAAVAAIGNMTARGGPVDGQWRAEPASDRPCLIAACSKCRYGFDENVSMTMHHATVEETATALRSCDWKFGPSGIVCPGCVEEAK